MDTTEIFIIRHGESVANLEHRAAGYTDTPLSQLGLKQAEATAEALAHIHFDGIYSSDLSRAYKTALPHAEKRGMTVTQREGLREVYLGEWEYLSVDEIVSRYGADSYYDGWRNNFGTYIVPGGEGAVKCGKRIYKEIEGICKEREGERILVVSHGAAIRTFCLEVMGVAPEMYAETLPYPSNASFTRVSYDGHGFKILEFSNDDHLASVGQTKVNW